MESKETVKGLASAEVLLYNEEYFKYIFKKTEKIAAAVFYVTRSLDDDAKKDILVNMLEERSRTLIETAAKTLRAPAGSRSLRLEELRIELISLESVLTLAHGAQIIALDLLEVFRHELTSVHRALRDFMPHHDVPSFGGNDRVETRGGDRRERRRLPAERSEASGGAPTGNVTRRERILSIIKDKGQASIKDVSTVMTEFSEKTIQRELMSLISEGLIKKEGERRWSRYSLLG